MLASEEIFQIFITLFTLSILTKTALLLLNIKHIKNHMQEVPAQFKQNIGLDEHIKAQKYTITKNKFSIINILFGGVILIIWLYGGGLQFIYDLLEPFQLNSIWFGISYFFIYGLINSFISIPMTLYSTFIIEEKYGFNKTTPKIFLTDLIKQFILSLVIGVPLIYGILYSLETMGSHWWLYTWIFIMSFQFVLIWAYPKFIAPFFNKFTTLDKEDLRQKIDNLGEKCQVTFKEYFVMNASLRSSHGNAYFTGFGKNKRIVFFDTLIESLEADEVIAVLAHELGHFKKKHILKSIMIGTVSMFIGFYILGLYISYLSSLKRLMLHQIKDLLPFCYSLWLHQLLLSF